MPKKPAPKKVISKSPLTASLPGFYLLLLLALILSLCFTYVITKYAKLKMRYERLHQSCTQVVVQPPAWFQK